MDLCSNFRLVTFYDNIVPNVAKSIQKTFNNDDKVGTYFDLTLNLNQVRFSIIELFRQCIKTPLDAILDKR